MIGKRTAATIHVQVQLHSRCEAPEGFYQCRICRPGEIRHVPALPRGEGVWGLGVAGEDRKGLGRGVENRLCG